MNSLGRNNDQKENKQSVFTKETVGVVLILFATLLFVCLITGDGIFSVPGKFVNAFMLGCFGYFSFLVTALMLVEGILLVAEKRLPLSLKQKVFVAIILSLVALLVHIVTMRGTDLDYGSYLANSYAMGESGLSACSGGGFFVALIAFPVASILSEVGSYVVLGVLIALSAYALVMDIVKNYRPIGKSANQKFRSSYVKKQKTDGNTVDGLELRDYPIEDLEYPDLDEKEKPVQKLFVNNSSDFGFKTRRELKNEDKDSGVKLQPNIGGFNVASPSKTYSETYGTEMQQRLEYIKTPAKIDLESTLNKTNSNYGSTYVSKPIPNPVNTTVSSYVSKAEPEKVEKPAEPETTIPLYEHDESSTIDNSAASHAERFSNSYVEIEDVEVSPTTTVQPATEYRSLRTETPIVETPVVEEKPAYEPAVDLNDNQREIPIPMIEEESELDEQPPATNIVRGEKSRSILFGVDKEEKVEEKPTFTERVISDSGNRRRSLFGMDNPVSEPEPKPEPVEEPKKEKEIVPINREYFRPPFDLLENHAQPVNAGQENHTERMDIIKRTLEEFHIGAIPQSYIQGPAFTRYEIKMPAGISVRKVLGYDDDLKMRLAAKDGVRIEAPIPGKDLVGIEVANTVKTMVGFRSVMEGLAEKGKKGSLLFAVGKDIVGNSISYDLAKGPHYLIAGATGSGKSVCLHVMIVSLLMRYSPEELKIVLIDPKSVEFRKYDHIPHLLVDEIITDAKRAITLLQWAYDETNRRNEMFTEYASVSNIDDYNSQVASDTVPKLPRIVFFIDELADLMETCKKDLEEKIRKIAAKSRSAGIHLVLATQRPSVDVITGTIKANLPSRIALRVMNFADSSTILGEGGAEKLLGNGDMLYKDSSMGNYERYQGAYISGREITNVVNYIKEHNKAYFDDEVKDYLEAQTNPKQNETVSEHADVLGDPNAVDALFLQALSLAVNTGSVSISQLQRRFQLGYARAGGIVDKMERMGFVSGNEGSKARRVLLTREEFEQRFGNISD